MASAEALEWFEGCAQLDEGKLTKPHQGSKDKVAGWPVSPMFCRFVESGESADDVQCTADTGYPMDCGFPVIRSIESFDTFDFHFPCFDTDPTLI